MLILFEADFALGIVVISFLKLVCYDICYNYDLADCFVLRPRNDVLKRYSGKPDPCGNAQTYIN